VTVPSDIYAQLRRDEGVKYDIYVDSEGWLTLGVGHRLRARALSDAAVDQILRDDVEATTGELLGAYPWVGDLSPARFGAVQNLAFNLGVAGLGTFVKFLAALQQGRWKDAAAELLDSRYAEQVGDRAKRLSVQIKEDRWV
jgi:lysozyme